MGELVNNEHPVFPEPGYVCYHGGLSIMYFYVYRPFFRTVKERVDKYFKENNIVSYA